MAWKQVAARARPGRQMRGEPYARICSAELRIHGSYIEQLGLEPGRPYEIHIDTERKRIGLKLAAVASDQTATLHALSASRSCSISSVRMVEAAGIGKYARFACAVYRDGDMVIVDTEARLAEAELLVA